MQLPTRDELLSAPTGAGALAESERPSKNVFGLIWMVSRRQQLVIIGLAILVALLDVVPLELQRRLIDNAIEAQSVSVLITLSLVYLGVLSVHALIKHALRVFQGAVSEDVLREARARLYCRSSEDETVRIDDEEAVAKKVGDDKNGDGGTRVAVLGHEIEQISVFAGHAFGTLVVQLGTIMGLVGYMIVTEPFLAMVSLPFLLPQAIIVPVLQARINRLSADRVEERRNLNSAVMDEDQERFMNTGRALRWLGVNVAWWKSVVRMLVNGCNAMAPLAVLSIGGYLAINGETTLGVLVAFVSGFQRLADPAKDLLDYYRNASLTQTRYKLVREYISRIARRDKDDLDEPTDEPGKTAPRSAPA